MKTIKGIRVSLYLSKKLLLAVLLICITFSITSILAVYLAVDSYFEKTPESGFWVKVSGEILPSEEVKGTTVNYRPKLLYIYSPYYLPDHLCYGSNTIKKTRINWTDDERGTYSTSFRVPVEMNVVLTTECSSRYYEEIALLKEKNEIQQDVEWGIKKEKTGDLELQSNPDDAIDQAKIWLDSFEARLREKEASPEMIQDIKQDIISGGKQIPEARRQEDSNKSLLYTYYADWFAWRAFYKIYLLDLKDCIEQDEILSIYNDSCYVPDYDSYEYFKSSNDTYASWSNRYFLRNTPDLNDAEDMKSEVRSVHRDVSELNSRVRECKDSLTRLNKTFEHQKSFCEKRETLFSIFSAALIVLAIEIGILAGLLLSDKRDS